MALARRSLALIAFSDSLLRDARAASGAAVQYTACTPSQKMHWEAYGGMVLHLVAAAFGPTRLLPQPAKPAFQFTVAFLALRNSSNMMQLMDYSLRAWQRAKYNPTLGLHRAGYVKNVKHYYLCPTFDIHKYLEAISCCLPCSETCVHGSLRAGHQLVLRCDFPADTVEGCNLDSGPDRLEVAVSFAVREGISMQEPARLRGTRWIADPFFWLCKRHVLSRKVTACTQPLHSHPKMASTHPSYLQDWLEYHAQTGLEHIFLYDIDASFEAAVMPFQESGFVSYFSHFADMLSHLTGAVSRHFKAHLCTEDFAYTHCFVSNHLVSDWILHLHAPDEYVAFPKRQSRRGTDAAALPLLPRSRSSKSWLAEVLPAMPRKGEAAGFRIHHMNFASDETCQASGSRGSVVRCATRRSMVTDAVRASPLLSPFCILASGHAGCQGEMHWMPSSRMRINHYVEFMPEHIGRCQRIHLGGPCNVSDWGLLQSGFFVSLAAGQAPSTSSPEPNKIME